MLEDDILGDLRGTLDLHFAVGFLFNVLITLNVQQQLLCLITANVHHCHGVLVQGTTKIEAIKVELLNGTN